MKNLKVARDRKGLTQDQLAEKLNVSRVTVARYESGDRWPDQKTLVKIADTLDCSIDFLLGRVPMNIEVKKETPPELPEGMRDIQLVIPDNASPEQLDATFEAAVRRIVRQELHQQDDES